MVRVFTVGEEPGHHVADRACPLCLEGYPEPCPCGGLIHAAGVLGVEDEDDEGPPTTRCDRCGRSEDDLDVV
jgi:hypothetical protein